MKTTIPTPTPAGKTTLPITKRSNWNDFLTKMRNTPDLQRGYDQYDLPLDLSLEKTKFMEVCMGIVLSESQKSFAIENGNILEVKGKLFQQNEIPTFNLDESSPARQQVGQLKLLLRSWLPDWGVSHQIIIHNQKPYVVLVNISLTAIPEKMLFPFSEFAKIVTASEMLAQEIVNPTGLSSDEYYLASDEPICSLDDLLKDMGITKERLSKLLPTLANLADPNVQICMPHLTGEQRAFRLPPTEQSRKPLATEAPQYIVGKVVEHSIEHGFITLDSGHLVNVSPLDTSLFLVGRCYNFLITGAWYTFSKRVSPVISDLIEQDEYSLGKTGDLWK